VVMSGCAYDPLKRAIDLIGAAAIFAATLPIQAVIAALIRIRLGSPILFRQDRPGKDGKIFTVVKFRTMRTGDASDADRMTDLGHRLRSLSLDELPTLINVIRGDMSLVGPRPLLVAYLERYTPEQARRHEVRPGITGLAQVSGRNKLTWDERFTLDIQYVDSRSLRFDLRVMARTLAPVIKRDGIAEEGSTTMSPFWGNSS